VPFAKDLYQYTSEKIASEYYPFAKEVV